MATNTLENELADARRRIGRLRTHAARVPSHAEARTRRRLAALQHEEAALRNVARIAPDDLEARLAQLKTRLDIAERSLAADLSHRRDRFTAAVEAELSGWDTYVERLQTTAATRARKAREQAEVAISDLRRRRIAVDEQLTRVRDAAGSAWKEQRERVAAARDELEEKADELSATWH